MLCLSCNKQMCDTQDDFVCINCNIAMYYAAYSNKERWCFIDDHKNVYSREKFIKLLKLKAFA